MNNSSFRFNSESSLESASETVSILKCRNVETWLAVDKGLDKRSIRRLYMRPYGLEHRRFRVDTHGLGYLEAELTDGNQVILRTGGLKSDQWVPTVLFQDSRINDSSLAVPWRSLDPNSIPLSYSVAADGGKSGEYDLTGKIDAGYVYEVVGKRSGTRLHANLYSPLEADLPTAIELRICCKTKSYWEYHTEVLQVPSLQVTLEAMTERDLEKRLKRLWMMLTKKSTAIRSLKCSFKSPRHAGRRDLISIVIYPTRLTQQLPMPSQGFLFENVAADEYITTRKLDDVYTLRDGNPQAIGFFVTLARQHSLKGDVQRLSRELVPKQRRLDSEEIREVQQTYVVKGTQEINAGKPTSLMTDDDQQKRELSQKIINNAGADFMRSAKRQNEFPSNPKKPDLTRHCQGLVDEAAPVDRLIDLETYSRALDLLESMTETEYVEAIRLKVNSGYSWTEAAEAFNLTPATLRSKLFRFRNEWCRLYGAEDTK